MTREELLAAARENHKDHAGWPGPLYAPVREQLVREGRTWQVHEDGWITVDHTDEECIKAFKYHAQKMSES